MTKEGIDMRALSAILRKDGLSGGRRHPSLRTTARPTPANECIESSTRFKGGNAVPVQLTAERTYDFCRRECLEAFAPWRSRTSSAAFVAGIRFVHDAHSFRTPRPVHYCGPKHPAQASNNSRERHVKLWWSDRRPQPASATLTHAR